MERSGHQLGGRGADRGLRGIAFAGDRVFLAASDEVFVYDPSFRLQGSFKNRYLKHCHEITVAGEVLYLTSTGFDSILEFDLQRERFVRGYCLRFSRVWRGPSAPGAAPASWPLRLRSRDGWRTHAGRYVPCQQRLRRRQHRLRAGTGLGTLWRIRDSRLGRFARIPYGSHNARPFREGVLLNHTATDRIAFLDRRGRIVYSYPLANYDERALIHTGLSRDMARPAFGRGLAVVSDRLFVGGSSPATVTAYQGSHPRFFDPSTSRWIFGTRCTVSRCGRSIPDRSSPLPLPPKESGGGATPYSVEPGRRSPHEIGGEPVCGERYRIERLDELGCLVAHRREPRFPDPAEVATAPPFAHRGPQRRPPSLDRLRRDRVVSNGPRGVAHAGPEVDRTELLQGGGVERQLEVLE